MAIEFARASSQHLLMSLVSAVTNNWSMATWVYPTDVTTNNQLTFYNGNNAADGFGIQIVGNGASDYIGLLFGGVGFNESTTTPTLNTWQHIAAVRDAGAVRIYKDAAEIYSATPTAPNTPVIVVVALPAIALEPVCATPPARRILRGPTEAFITCFGSSTKVVPV
mgnify:CR=1 FL=1